MALHLPNHPKPNKMRTDTSYVPPSARVVNDFQFAQSLSAVPLPSSASRLQRHTAAIQITIPSGLIAGQKA